MVNWTMIFMISIPVIFVLWIILSYNAFIRLRNQVENSWAQIDVQLKRRTDLIPNLINTVKGYMKHEREVLENVTKARTSMINAKSPKQAGMAEGELAGALKTLFAVSENYPDLKASQNFLQLQEELSGTENKISFARQYYNDRVLQYNTRRESFPSNIIAAGFKFGPREYFEVPETEKVVPKVEF